LVNEKQANAVKNRLRNASATDFIRPETPF